jgi:hypothetical protein
MIFGNHRQYFQNLILAVIIFIFFEQPRKVVFKQFEALLRLSAKDLLHIFLIDGFVIHDGLGYESRQYFHVPLNVVGLFILKKLE